MGDTPSGMDMNHLHLSDKAAERVGKLFDELSKELAIIRAAFKDYRGNMGMGACEEGNSWNDKITAVGQSVFDATGGFVDEIDSFAAKATAAQSEFDEMERRNKEAQIKLNPMGYTDISNNAVFPPFKAN